MILTKKFLSTKIKSIYLFLIGGIFLSIALWIASLYPGDGNYEISIYQAYPLIFWFFFIASLISGYLIFINEINNSEKNRKWFLGVIIIAGCNLFIVGIPFLRDYAYASQFDSVIHASRIASIIKYGHPFLTNSYPIAHVLTAAFTLLSHLSVIRATVLVPVFFYIFYLASLILMAIKFNTKRQFTILLAAIGMPLVIGTYPAIFRPYLLALYTIPFFLTWLFEAKSGNQKTQATILFILTLLFLPFTHAIVALAILLLMILLTLTGTFSDIKSPFTIRKMYTPISILLVLWLSFFSSLYIFPWVIKKLVASVFFNHSGRNMALSFAQATQHARLPFQKIISVIFFNFGATLFYLIPVLIAVIWTILLLFRSKRNMHPNQLALSLFSIFIGIIAFSSLFIDFITYSPIRYLSIIVITAPLFIVITFVNYSKVTTRHNHSLITGVLLFSIVSAILGVFNNFESPLTGRPNWQFSYAQRSGNVFLINKAVVNENSFIYAPISGYRNMDSALNNHALTLLLHHKPFWAIRRAPDHFGYDPNQQQINPSSYLFLTAYEHAFYIELWSKGGRIEKKDYERLQNDPSWQYIYSSGDFDIWQKSTNIDEQE